MDTSRAVGAARGAAWAVAGVLVAAVAAGHLQAARAAGGGPELRVSGSVQGLAPGSAGALVLTVTSPSDEPQALRSLAVQVTGTSDPACPAAALQVTAWQGQATVSAAAPVVQPLTAVLAADAPAACAGATWRLAYRAA